jgi:hypothetical protein
MRFLRMMLLLVFSLLIIAGPAAAAPASSGLGAVIVHPRWHRITGNVQGPHAIFGNAIYGFHGVVAGAQDLALTSPSGQISLLNKRSRDREPLSPPCPSATAAGFGGPWFAVSCPSQSGPQQIALYNLSTGLWTEQTLAAVCDYPARCTLDGVGTTWIRFLLYENPDDNSHDSYAGYLQNIATGAAEADPFNAPNSQDDLDAPSAIGHPCTTLAFSTFDETYGSYGPLVGAEPYWHQVGRFVLTTGINKGEITGPPDYLYGCNQKLKLRLPLTTLASTKAVLYKKDPSDASPPLVGGSDVSLYGRYLPTLRRFTIPKPKGTAVALSNTTLYTIVGTSLWAGTFANP